MAPVRSRRVPSDMVNELDTKLANEMIPLAGLDASVATVAAATLAASLVLFTLVWAIHVKIEDAGIVDFAWGGSFFVTGLVAAAAAGGATPAMVVLLAMVGLWAARLTVHMAWRHRMMDGEDARYRAMREATGPSFWWKSLFKVFWVQAAVQWIVATPLLAAALWPVPQVSAAAAGAGVFLFAAGLAIETVADRQLWRFKARPGNRGKLMTDGLFAWSRHPNYFGEALLWWGIGIVAHAASGSLLSYAGPALLTFLLLKVSGVDLLDAHLDRTRPDYRDWAARTPAFLPRPPRRDAGPARDGAGPRPAGRA